MNPTQRKPTILFVHGSWHTPEPYQKQLRAFQDAGFPTACPQLPSFAAAPTVGLPEDAKCIIEALDVLVNKQHDHVIVVAHSYGGVVATQAVHADFGAKAVAGRGEKGGVIAMLYVAAFILPLEESLGSALGGGPPPHTKLPPFIPVDDEGMCTMLDPAHRFYSDLSAGEAEHWVSLLKPCPAKTQLDVVTYAAYLHHPVTYLVCENDQALPSFLQRKMIAEVEVRYTDKGLKFDIETCEAGHSPFLSMPEVLASAIEKMATKPL